MSSRKLMSKKNASTPRSGKKSQGNILSFFGKSASRKQGTPNSSKLVDAKTSPVSAFRVAEKSGASSAKIAKSAPSFIPSTRRLTSANEKRNEVCRELFNENAGKRALPLDDSDNPIQSVSQRTKKLRRIMRIAESDDEEEDCTFTIPEEGENLPSSQVSNDESLLGAEEGFGEGYLPSLACPTRMAAPSQNSDGNASGDVQVAPELSRARQAAREKLSGVNMTGEVVGEEEGGWCDRNPWSKDIRDSKKRRPGDEGYDKTTLYVPPSAFGPAKQKGLSPFQQQFWSIKMKNYDVLIFFKKGKFYELYDVDADIGHKVLGLSYTKGGRVDMRCCGVPEQSFEKHTVRLIDFGYKVGRVEQTETANAAANRKASQGGNKPTVCERALVRILTRATVTDDALLRDHRARYVLSILESHCNDSDAMDEDEKQSSVVTVAVCYVDAASGDITIREYEDDFRRSETERLFACLRPQEIIIDRTAISDCVSKLVRWRANRTGAEIIDNYEDGFPEMTSASVAQYLDSCRFADKYKTVCAYIGARVLGSKAFGAMTSYLKSLIIDKEILSLGNYNLFPAVGDISRISPPDGEDCDMSQDKCERTESSCTRLEEPFGENALSPVTKRVRMDAATMAGLEVISNNMNGSERGSLLSFIDRASTPAGRRLLKKWISAPLTCSAEVNDRLNAVDAFLKLDQRLGSEALTDISKKLSSGRDLERALPRLHQQAVVQDSAVMFDDTNKRRVKDFVKILRSLESTLLAVDETREALSSVTCESKRLNWLVAKGGGVPVEAAEKLRYFLTDAFDVIAAETSGELVPQVGAAPDFDRKRDALSEIENGLEAELNHWRKELKDRDIKFYHRGKEPYQLAVSTRTLDRRGTPREFQTTSETKNVSRFYTRTIRNLLKDHLTVSEDFEIASKCVVREVVSQFDQDYEIWSAVSKTSAELDALLGLSRASLGDGVGSMCRPEVLRNDHPHPVFEAKGLRHPVLAAMSDSFVPNDVSLGSAGNPSIAVLTGPNAGGKSTLSRQVAVCALLAQVGCYAPAEKLTFRPFEDVFVRMGAGDDVSRGLSTFMVEMEDVSNILNNATSTSLSILDEVGRGTSTFDGYAIAFATLKHLATRTKCITIFSTHYSCLGTELALECDGEEGTVGMYEMAAEVDESLKKITFLYKFQKGIGGFSRGICCARLAGIPTSVADDAEIAATQFEKNLTERLSSSSFQAVMKAVDQDERTVVDALHNL